MMVVMMMMVMMMVAMGRFSVHIWSIERLWRFLPYFITFALKMRKVMF